MVKLMYIRGNIIELFENLSTLLQENYVKLYFLGGYSSIIIVKSV